MPWTKSVFSSRVSEVAYDETTKELFVTWAKGGKRSIYSDVPEEVALDLSASVSVGTMIGTEIIPNYSHRYG
jgi:hypothetical protein